jgi:hypothetical protein
MGSIVPLVIVVAILAVTSITALIAAFVTERRTYAGYEEIRPDILQLKSLLSAEVFRDGTDLVISGTRQKLPVVVRFSYAETTPGLNIRVHGPATMNLAIVPRNSTFYLPENLRANVPLGDDMLNSRFQGRADDSAAARMFMFGGATTRELPKALCSTRTTLFISHGALELSETVIPQYAGNHATGHIDSLVKLSGVLAQMPGAQLAVVEKPQLPKRFLTKIAIVAGAAAALVSIVGAAQQLREAPQQIIKPANQLAVEERGAGVLAVDAKVIPDLDNFRVVKPAEFDPAIVSWMRGQNVEPDGRVPLTLTTKQQANSVAESTDVAYLLTDPQDHRRLVMVSSGRVVFDVRNFGPISIVRVPRSDIPPPERGAAPDGDGLLVIVDPNAPEKSFLLYMVGDMVQNRPEPNWTQLSLH